MDKKIFKKNEKGEKLIHDKNKIIKERYTQPNHPPRRTDNMPKREKLFFYNSNYTKFHNKNKKIFLETKENLRLHEEEMTRLQLKKLDDDLFEYLQYRHKKEKRKRDFEEARDLRSKRHR